MSWYTKNPITWIKQFVKAWWDSLIYKWDDTTCTWDATPGRDEWRTKNPPDWYTKNT